jgi:hypothetical protein
MYVHCAMYVHMYVYKKLTCKGTLRQVFCLSKAPSPPMTPYPPFLTHCIRVNSILIHTREGVEGQLTREKVRWATVHKAGRKYQHDRMYLESINSIKLHTRKEKFIKITKIVILYLQ